MVTFMVTSLCSAFAGSPGLAPADPGWFGARGGRLPRPRQEMGQIFGGRLGEVVLTTGFRTFRGSVAIGTRRWRVSGGGWGEARLTRTFIWLVTFFPAAPVAGWGRLL